MGGADLTDPPKVLAYALPWSPEEERPRLTRVTEGMDLYDVPMSDPSSFLNADAVVLFAGCFEEGMFLPGQQASASLREMSDRANDLDRRHREFSTLTQGDKPFVFLVPRLPQTIGSTVTQFDLFYRVLTEKNIEWQQLPLPSAPSSPMMPEFTDFIRQYGLAHIHFKPHAACSATLTPICNAGGWRVAFELNRVVFFLPCNRPSAHTEALKMAVSAVRAVLAYRQRTSRILPDWARNFTFAREREICGEITKHEEILRALESKCVPFSKWKGALCYKSDPLVEVVTDLLEGVFGLQISREDRKIEDARIVGEHDETLAVIEIKGDNGTFKRADINQVDNHRERNGLTQETPGLLIINTMMKATSLVEKEDPPHHNMIEKAVADNVLLVRTLDLLRCADQVDHRKTSKEAIRKLLLSGGGWLKAEQDAVQVVKS